MSFTIEEEQGTCTATLRQHDGYYAGDFSQVPMATPRQLAAMTQLRPVGFDSPLPR
ncbi:hypothetical protein [Nocardioides guangzhouensis]|uniref:hypothetical protein n=1 Tax=Nocardioides guangzhouensis TaxID=2497878 RepID=UPI0014385CD8|nr:hypothetical protein [Nocardioides guangzhouensis]